MFSDALITARAWEPRVAQFISIRPQERPHGEVGFLARSQSLCAAWSASPGCHPAPLYRRGPAVVVGLERLYLLLPALRSRHSVCVQAGGVVGRRMPADLCAAADVPALLARCACSPRWAVVAVCREDSIRGTYLWSATYRIHGRGRVTLTPRKGHFVLCAVRAISVSVVVEDRPR